jgi:16S rRNA (uracil1498-N3)-methyltransferase
MRIPRLYVEYPLAVNAIVPLPDPVTQHVARVLRLGRGDGVILFNGDGHDYRGVLEAHGRGGMAALIASASPVARESPLAITLVQALARGEKMDLVLQKATELGVTCIVPLVSERTEVRLDDERAGKRREHWQRVVSSACEQCGRAVLPEVCAPIGIADYAAGQRMREATKLVLHPGVDTKGLKGLGAIAGEVILAIGPEGGFSERDIDALTQGGFVQLALGPRVLRTETAGLAAIAALQARFGDFA